MQQSTDNESIQKRSLNEIRFQNKLLVALKYILSMGGYGLMSLELHGGVDNYTWTTSITEKKN